MDKLCPMKFNLVMSESLTTRLMLTDSLEKSMLCDKASCAWYCDYGECAILSLPSLYNAISQVSTDIRQNKGELI